MGLMNVMVTISHNDSCPEMLAAIRRGLFAKPTDEEMVEFLLQRKKISSKRPKFEEHSLEHVLSYQRRNVAFKRNFLQRDTLTPLGIVKDWFDRTEAQMRAALHAHMLIWMKPRERNLDYKQLPPIPRKVPGSAQHQRPLDDKNPVPSFKHQEDSLYHTVYVNRISTEMARPNLGKKGNLGGFDVEKLRIVGLARCLQTKLCLHACSTRYCLLNRSTCRFFFPHGA